MANHRRRLYLVTIHQGAAYRRAAFRTEIAELLEPVEYTLCIPFFDAGSCVFTCFRLSPKKAPRKALTT